jgi:hypothetical protein
MEYKAVLTPARGARRHRRRGRQQRRLLAEHARPSCPSAGAARGTSCTAPSKPCTHTATYTTAGT